MYDIPYKHDKDYDKLYAGETGWLFGTRLKEHQKKTQNLQGQTGRFQPASTSTWEHHNFLITDHIARENHIIDWEGASIL